MAQALSDTSPALIRCTRTCAAHDRAVDAEVNEEDAEGGSGLRQKLLDVASKVPGGYPAQGGWEEASAEISQQAARLEQSDHTGTGTDTSASESAAKMEKEERLGWLALSLLPLSAGERQRLLQCDDAGKREHVAMHLLARILDRC